MSVQGGFANAAGKKAVHVKVSTKQALPIPFPLNIWGNVLFSLNQGHQL